MSSREPLWYCHECNAEMRPLMVPDPVCASCRGSFVEKMENPSDDPREFHQALGPDLGGAEDMPLGLEAFLYAIQNMARGPGTERTGPRSRPTDQQRSRSPNVSRTFEIRSSTGNGPPTAIRFGSNGGGISSPEDPDQPTMTDFLRRRGEAGITGPLMAHYLMALLGGRESMGDVFGRGMGEPMQPGRMGDYVFNQEALDEILNQLMENSNAHRPVAASDEIVDKLPREVLEEGSPTLEKDCAVCKEQFSLQTEDPDEQVVVTLPCKHPFHQPCILPWLKSSGTCPVCRFALVPQPEQHGSHGPTPGGSSDAPGNGPPTGLLQSLFGHVNSGGNRTSPRRSNSDSTGGQSSRVPGAWDELD
ncbi:unnamed protein product [Mycena citricolor]|uniref:RING-type domain-containing protein n=1 Tax=Mycena citricolor TaxID=2018698 RepID=A0AAD2HTR2_9AGAR|nr:unnamed protein product [Mycena citricolor]